MNENNNGAPEVPVAQPAQPAPVAPAQPAPAPEPQAAPAQPVQQAAPQPETDRTGQQFEKLVESNKQLYQANELLRQQLQSRSQSNQTFAPAQQPAPQAQVTPQGSAPATPVTPTIPQGTQMPKVTDFIEIDPKSGERYINQTKFEAAVTDINSRARRAEETVQNYIQQAEQREIDRQNREAWQAYPELNPATQSFDARFAQQARAIIYDSMINPQDYGGRPLGFKDAADFLKGSPVAPRQEAAPIVPQPVAPVMDPAVAAQNQTQKEQASLAATPQPQQAQQYASNEEAYQSLVKGTRAGSDEALARRLLNTPHKLEDIEAAVAGN